MHHILEMPISPKFKSCKKVIYFAKYPYEIKPILQVLYEVYFEICKKSSVQNNIQYFYNCSTFYMKLYEKMNN